MIEQNPGARWASPAMQDHLRRRHRAERRFRRAGAVAIGLALLGLVTLLASIARNGWSAFRATEVQLDVAFDPALFEGIAEASRADREALLAGADYAALVRSALRAQFPEVEGRPALRELSGLVSAGAREELRTAVIADPALIGATRAFWLPADDEVDLYRKGRISSGVAEEDRHLSDAQLAWI